MLSSKFWKIELNLFSRKSKICFSRTSKQSRHGVFALSSGVRRKFPMGAKFCHNRVTSQINLGSTEGTTIIKWSGDMPRKNFAKLHLKIRIFVPGKSEAFRKPKKRSHMLQNPGRTPNTCKKTSFAFPKTAWFCFTVFHF